MRDLPSGPVPTEKTLDCRAEMEKAIASLQELSRHGKLPAIPEGVLTTISNTANGFLSRMAEIGPRETLLQYSPVVRYSKAEQLKLTTDELSQSLGFRIAGPLRWK